MTEDILFDRRGALGIVTLNRPKALNAQNLAMVQAFTKQLDAWEANDSVTRLLIHGAGEKAFCAGGDIRALWTQDFDAQMAFFETEYDLCYRLARSRLTTIAYMDGITMGGGVGLSIHATYRLATERTLWAMPEALIGFFPDIAASHFLPRNKLGAGFGRYLGLTGARLSGTDCLAAGIATHYVASGLDDHLIDRLARLDLEQALVKCEQSPPPSTVGDLAQSLNPHAAAPLAEFLDELKQRNLLPADVSPLSLQVIDAALTVGRRLGYRETVEMDKRIVKHFLTNNSFAEGVRARLIDRDQQPDWLKNPPAPLTEAEIVRYFA